MSKLSFYECASFFEENWTERATINALRNHATGAGMGIVLKTLGHNKFGRETDCSDAAGSEVLKSIGSAEQTAIQD